MHGLKMTDILKHDVCFSNDTVETEMPSMCILNDSDGIKEGNESRTDDLVHNSNSKKFSQGEKGLQMTSATVKEGLSEKRKETTVNNPDMISENRAETDDINSYGGKSSKIFADVECNDKEESTIKGLSCVSMKSFENVKYRNCLDTPSVLFGDQVSDVVKHNRKSVCGRETNGNVHSVIHSNLDNKNETEMPVLKDEAKNTYERGVKMEVDTTKEKFKRGKVHPIKIEVDKTWDITEDGMGFTDDSDDDMTHTDLDKLFLGRIRNKEKGNDLLKFAEVLYKCTLCTSIPSILTSEESFIKHVNIQHLSEDTRCHSCKVCSLKVRTEEDLKEHVNFSHTGSEENLSCDLTGSDITGSQDQVIDSNNDSDSDSSGHRQLRAKVIKRSKPVQDFDSPKQLVDHTGIETLDGSLDLTQKRLNEKREVENAKGSKSCKEGSEIDIKQITDQIIKSDVQGRNVSQGNHSHLPYIPGFTAEFGKYTKLVREGGNIVYFCQICNWKSPIKTTFQVHCNMTSHKNKVLSAENPEDSNDSSSKSPKHGEKNIGPTMKNEKTTNKDRRSYCAQDISVGPRMPDQNLFYNFIMKRRGGSQYRGRTPVVSPYGTSSFIEDARFTYKRPNEHPVDLAIKKRKRNVKHQKHGQNSDSDSDESRENEKCFLSKSNHSSNMTLLRQKLLEGSCGKKVTYNEKERKDTESLYSFDFSEDVNSNESNYYSKPLEISSFKNEKLKLLMSDGAETHKEYMTKNYSSSQDGRVGILHATSSGFKYRAKDDIKIVDSFFTQYKCHACSFRYSNVDEYEKHFDKVHKSSVVNLFCLQKESSYSKGQSWSQGLGDYGTASKLNMESGLDMDGRGEPLTVRGDQHVTGSCEMGENWRVQKLKELLPDYVIECERGNTSRDYLLQCISNSSGIQDAVLWSSACNRAIRELFPNSQAQRKGKYKNTTYYFGISLLDAYQLQEEPPGVEGESLLYQPHRDINIDMEKIVEHLPFILKWTGNMDCGVHRQDLLILLCETIHDSDVCNWGAQCNRAIRLVFPNIDMKRKGKYKTMYLGVEFQKDVLMRLSKYNNKCGIDLSNRKTPQNSADNSKDYKKGKTLERLLSRNSNSPEKVSQQEYTSTENRSPLITYPHWMKKEDQIEMGQYLAKFGGVSMFDVQNGTQTSDVYKENECDQVNVEQNDEKCNETIPLEQGDDSIPLEQSDKSIQLEQSDKSIQLEQSDKSIQLEQGDKSIQLEQSDESIQLEQGNDFIQLEQGDDFIQLEQDDKSIQLEQDDKSIQLEQGDKSIQLEQGDDTDGDDEEESHDNGDIQ